MDLLNRVKREKGKPLLHAYNTHTHTHFIVIMIFQPKNEGGSKIALQQAAAMPKE